MTGMSPSTSAVEEHWHHLLAAMGREDLRNDPRFKTNADRVARIDETDGLVGTWTRTLSKMEVFTITKEHRIPCAPVGDVAEVMRDAHMHERGMLEWIDHDEIGPLVVPTSPLRFSRRGQGSDRTESQARPAQ
jgi:CoA:oxalate CoA-transferase